MARKSLLVFDNSIDIAKLLHAVRGAPAEEICLFPLTGTSTILKGVENSLRTRFKTVSFINSAQLIEWQTGIVRDGICKWSASLGEFEIAGRNLKEWFMIPGHAVSAWWFALISEKNTFKTDIFFQIIQVGAVKEALERGPYDSCFVAISATALRQSIIRLAGMEKIPAIKLPILSLKKTAGLFRGIANRMAVISDPASGIAFILRLLIRGNYVRRYLARKRRNGPNSQRLLFVTYFPGVNKDAAEKGIFCNRYAPVLQDKLKELNVPVTWLLMYAPLDGYSFYDAVRLAGKFSDNGEDILMPEEFFNAGTLFTCLYFWLRQTITALYVYKRIDKKVLFSGPVGEECEPLIKDLWRISFYGSLGIGGLTHYFIFKEMFSRVKGVKDCLYYCEMQAWEKAMNAAKTNSARDIRTIGAQHTSIAKNYFYYFYHNNELRRTGSAADMPLPDMLAANGDFSHTLFENAGYSNVKKVEAARYVYLNEKMSADIRAPKRKKAILIAGSADKNECRNLILMVNEAFPKRGAFNIWFKGYPSWRLETIFEELGIDIPQTGYVICHGDISQYLEESIAVVVPTSTVAVEALAFGCEVIVPVFPDNMFRNPLADFDGYYHRVSSAKELANILERILGGYSLHSVDEYRRFIRNYWYMDEKLPRWSNILTENHST